MAIPAQTAHLWPNYHVVPDVALSKANKVVTYKVVYKSYLQSFASLPGYNDPRTENVKEGKTFINKLPAELLAEIFEMAIVRIPITAGGRRWKSQSHYLTLGCQRNRAPFSLLQVCSSWRAIAQSTSSLWSSISGLQIRRSRPAVHEMQHWLKNSGSAPLRLHLDRVVRSSVYEDPFLPHALLGVFVTQAHRWESLALSLNAPLVQEFTAILQNDRLGHGFPFLAQLELYLDLPGPGDQHTIDQLATAVSSVKTLRRIYWGVNIVFEGCLNLPWKQLDTVHIIMAHSTNSAISWISQCSAASKITLRGARIPTSTKNMPIPDSLCLHLPCLRHLDLEGEYAIGTLTHFVLPNLETLHIQTRSSEPNAYCTLEALLDRSQCLLKEVVISESCLSTIISELALHCLSIAPLHAVPTVEITHDDIHTSLYPRLQAKSFPGNGNLPRILGWQSSGPFSCPGIGWKDLEPREEKRFSWDNGKIETFCDPSLLVLKPE